MATASSLKSPQTRNKATKRKGAPEPTRTCIGCRRVRPQSKLVRISRGPDGMLVTGRNEPGRGAWLCAMSTECFEAAARRGAFARALRTEIAPAAVDDLRARWWV